MKNHFLLACSVGQGTILLSVHISKEGEGHEADHIIIWFMVHVAHTMQRTDHMV